MKTAQDILDNKHTQKIVSVAPGETIADAIHKMNSANIGAILVEDKGNVVGIWTERDLLRSIEKEGFDPRKAVLSDHMSTALHFAPHDTPVERLEEMFLGLYIRHILVKKDDRFIGLLSIGDVLRASLLEKDRHIRKLNTIASWQYYENWGWDRKKQQP